MLATDGTVATDPAQIDDESPAADKSAPEAHDEGTDQEPGKAMLFPSSLGMSFAVEPGTDTIQALATWGEYRRVDNPVPPEERPDWQQDDKFNRCWQRSPQSAEASIALADGDLGPFDFDAAHGIVRISGTCRTASTGFRLVTLFLHNRQLIPGSNPDEAWLFQPALEVTLDRRRRGLRRSWRGRGCRRRIGNDRGPGRASSTRHDLPPASRVRPRACGLRHCRAITGRPHSNRPHQHHVPPHSRGAANGAGQPSRSITTRRPRH